MPRQELTACGPADFFTILGRGTISREPSRGQERDGVSERALDSAFKDQHLIVCVIIVGDFNTPLSPMDRSSKMKINKEIQALNDTLNKMDLIDIYRTFHPKTTEYTFF